MHQSFDLLKKETIKSEYYDKISSQKLFSSWKVRIFGKISPKFSYSQKSGFEICSYSGLKQILCHFLGVNFTYKLTIMLGKELV